MMKKTKKEKGAFLRRFVCCLLASLALLWLCACDGGGTTDGTESTSDSVSSTESVGTADPDGSGWSADYL